MRKFSDCLNFAGLMGFFCGWGRVRELLGLIRSVLVKNFGFLDFELGC